MRYISYNRTIGFSQPLQVTWINNQIIVAKHCSSLTNHHIRISS
uniref:Uncharacterized protein n=1 Tax=Medicago truncatula TaxID=3880 RepID=I3SP03_MEDTR|nr:unknown [Medicago truncatula]